MATQYSYQNAYAPPPAPDYLSPGPPQYQQQQCNQLQPQQSAPAAYYAAPPSPSYGYNGTTTSQAPPVQPPSPYYQQQALYPPPSYPTTPQPGYSPGPPQQTLSPSPAPPSFPPRYNSAPAVPQPVHHPDIKFTLNLLRKEKSSYRNKFRDCWIWTLSSTIRPLSYTLVFTTPSKLHRDADLVVYRGSKKVGRCDWIHKVGMHRSHLNFPFMKWPTPWTPETERWGSDTGTLEGDLMQWEYGTDPNDASINAIIRCLSTGFDINSKAKGEKDIELCKVVIPKGDHDACATVHLPGKYFGGAKEEQFDEMLVCGMVLVTIWSCGWRAAAAANGQSVSANEVLHLTNETLGLVSNIVSAAGGGGGA